MFSDNVPELCELVRAFSACVFYADRRDGYHHSKIVLKDVLLQVLFPLLSSPITTSSLS